MGHDESFLVKLVEALVATRLEALIVGATAAVLQGAPVMTRDIDLLVRDTPLNRKKLEAFAKLLGAAKPAPVSELTSTVAIIGSDLPIDVLFDRMSGRLSFASVRSRSVALAVGKHVARLASLEDIIRSKEAAGRKKDQVQLPILRETLLVNQALEKKKPE
jgi:uncharacterized ParB-like nuclease family protein